MPSRTATYSGRRAERSAARKFGLEPVDDQDVGDLRASNGVVYSVKSTVHTRANGSPGRFRFQRSKFTDVHERRSAVILVLFPSVGSSTNRPLKVAKVSTADVVDAINADGGWVRAGHASFDYQRRVPWPSLMSI